MFRFLLDIPIGAHHLDVCLDYLGVGFGASHGGNSADLGSEHVTVLPWHVALLYPEAIVAAEVPISVSVTLPNGWDCSTALVTEARDGDEIRFAETDLETLVDSPVLAGRHLVKYALNAARSGMPSHSLDVAADVPNATQVPQDILEGLARLPAEAHELFGAFAFPHYTFLAACSDHYRTGFISGLEHLSSTDIRAPLGCFSDPHLRYNVGLVFPHEYVHAWNGKLHRPSGEAVPNFNTRIRTDEVWISEGLTTYWGELLAVRCGLWSEQTFHEQLAHRVALLEHQAGRSWRNLQDVANGQEAIMTAKSWGASWRRDEDYYTEGALIWMDADLRIRSLSAGHRSLDDFARLLFGARQADGPHATPYTTDSVYAALENVVSGDWRTFFVTRLNQRGIAPSRSLEGTGWGLEYHDQSSKVIADVDAARRQLTAWFSIGIVVRADGEIADVKWGSPADQAGLNAGQSVRRINGEPFGLERLEAALRVSASGEKTLQLGVEAAGQQREVALPYHGGPRYPVLVRDQPTTDALAPLLRSRSPEAQVTRT